MDRIETSGWALPMHAPLYFRRMGQKVIWHKAIQVAFRADPDVLRTFLPEPFELAGDEVVAGITEHYQPGHGLPVKGGGISLSVKFGDITGRYSALTISSSDEVVCANREELGSAAVLGRIKMWSEGNTWFGVACRNGQDVYRISVFPERVVAPEVIRMWGARGPALNYKRIPSVDPNRKPWRQIMAVSSERQGPLIEHSIGRGAVEILPTAWGVHRIQPIEVLHGSVWHFEGGELKTIECLWEDRPEPVG
jgi:hypothetical protein